MEYSSAEDDDENKTKQKDLNNYAEGKETDKLFHFRKREIVCVDNCVQAVADFWISALYSDIENINENGGGNNDSGNNSSLLTSGLHFIVILGVVFTCVEYSELV